MKENNKQSGFSLLELLIVVCIVLLISAIAVPKLLQARTTAVENSAGATTRTINTAVVGYNAKFGVFPATGITALGGTPTQCSAGPSLTSACLLDDGLATALASPAGVGQYVYTLTVPGAAGEGYTLAADPLATSSAKAHYWTSDSLAIHINLTQPAAASDPLIGQ